MSIYIDIASLLIDIEAELRRLRLWQVELPAAEALASTEPFCVDTLTFPQWLQFVFLPRKRALIRVEQLPPGRCEIAPLAEQYFGDSQLDATRLLRAVAALDGRLRGD